MKTLSGICLVVLLISSCRTPENALLPAYFHTGKLPAQSFIIHPDRDTTLVSSGGIRIRIPSGSFEGDKPVTLEWKEALQFDDMLRAGLLTQSGKNILSSGGMFYLNTKENVDMQKPIEIDVPTKTVVSGMQLYKGESADGKIDWQDPKPIENVKAFGENALGKALFNGNCAQCHGIDRAYTAPALAGVTGRKSKQWLYAMTRNPSAIMAIDPYLQCEKCKYGIMMQAFPALSESDMDSVYTYIEDETERLGLTGIVKNNECDSCAILNSAYDSLLSVYNRLYAVQYLQRDTSLFGKSDRSVNPVNDLSGYNTSTINTQVEKYYQVTIQADGWYNIDVLFKEQSGAVAIKLIVKPQGESNQEMKYYLAIPALKILTEERSFGNGDQIVFGEEDGTIMLPQSRQAIIIAVGGTGNNYFFSKTTFIISAEQTINLSIQKIPKQQFDAQLTELSYYGLNSGMDIETPYQDTAIFPANRPDMAPETTDSRNANRLAAIEKQLQDLSSKKFKNCGCDTYPSAAFAKDTISAIRAEQATTPKSHFIKVSIKSRSLSSVDIHFAIPVNPLFAAIKNSPFPNQPVY